MSALGPVQLGSAIPINNGNCPRMIDGLLDWFQPITMIRITKTVVNFQNVEVQVPTTFYGVKQPMRPQSLNMRPIGQRQWKWYDIFSYPTLILVPDDIIQIDGVKFRIMDKTDWKEHGFVHYTCIEDYT